MPERKTLRSSSAAIHAQATRNTAPAAGPRNLKLLCHVGEVGTNPRKVNLENIADLAQLVRELRPKLDDLGVPPAGPVAVHLLQGAELGSRVSDLSELGDTEKICLVAGGEGVPPAAATATPEAVPGGDGPDGAGGDERCGAERGQGAGELRLRRAAHSSAQAGAQPTSDL